MKESYQSGPLPEKKDESIKNTIGKVGVGIAATFASLGISDRALAQHGSTDQTKDKTNQTTPDIDSSAEKGFLNNKENNQDLSKFFTEDFISDVALSLKSKENYRLYRLILDREFTNSGNCVVHFMNLDGIKYDEKTWPVKIESEIKKEREKLNNNDKEIAKKKISELLILVGQAKLEVIKHVQSNEYLGKMIKEMKISKKEAQKHQGELINNVKSILVNFNNSMRISFEEGALGYYKPWSHEIVIPYDTDIEQQKNKDVFCGVLIHEIIHGLTKAKTTRKEARVFKKSFKKADEKESEHRVGYLASPVELIVRKQMLDIEMEKLGIKKYGEKFTEDHYKKILELKKENKLSQGSIELIDHIKSENFPKIMNELAETKENNDNYYSPEWNYKNIDNQA